MSQKWLFCFAGDGNDGEYFTPLPTLVAFDFPYPFITKVACSAMNTFALSDTGDVYSW